MNKDMVPLHLHTEFSPLDGVGKTEEYAERAAELGFEAVSINDHGTLAGHREFVRSMDAVGVKPILGVEAYYTENRFDNRDKNSREDPLDVVYNHLVIYAKDDAGLENLNRLNEIGWTEGFYKKPRIDWEVLNKYGDGLIITSGCMSGVLNKAIEHDRLADAKSQISKFSSRFGDDFYVEVMPHNVAGMNAQLLALADSSGVKSVVTQDCHHVTKEQKVIQEVMLITGTHAKIQKDATFKESQKIEDFMERLDYLYGADRMMSFNKFDIHLLSLEEMKAQMVADGVDREDIYSNSLEIASKVSSYNMPENLDLLPAEYRNPDERLYTLVRSAMRDFGFEGVEEYEERVELEMRHISVMNQSKYLLLVSNMVNWSKKNGIMVGVGRGSGAGCLVGYLLGITGIDPIKHNLLFARFVDAGTAVYAPTFVSM